MSWTDVLNEAQNGMETFGAAQAATAEGFGKLHEASIAEGKISAKNKELMALALGIAKQCVDCIGFHVKASIDAGASREEIEETVGVCILMGGGPSYMYGVKALQAYDEFTA